MGIVATWNAIEAALMKRGIPLQDIDSVQQARRATLRVAEIPSDQDRRGGIGSGIIRLTWGIEVTLTYDVGNDKRVERKVAEDAEAVIAAIYKDVNLTNHHFVGASIERNKVQGVVTNTMRFDFQDQASL